MPKWYAFYESPSSYTLMDAEEYQSNLETENREGFNDSNRGSYMGNLEEFPNLKEAKEYLIGHMSADINELRGSVAEVKSRRARK